MASSSRKNQQGVGVDADAVAKNDPVTVVVSPAGNRYDADNWADAYSYVGAGYAIAEGYPTGPSAADLSVDNVGSSTPPTATASTSTASSG